MHFIGSFARPIQRLHHFVNFVYMPTAVKSPAGYTSLCAHVVQMADVDYILDSVVEYFLRFKINVYIFIGIYMCLHSERMKSLE
jgi:hypothetical protein